MASIHPLQAALWAPPFVARPLVRWPRGGPLVPGLGNPTRGVLKGGGVMPAAGVSGCQRRLQGEEWTKE